MLTGRQEVAELYLKQDRFFNSKAQKVLVSVPPQLEFTQSRSADLLYLMLDADTFFAAVVCVAGLGGAARQWQI